MGTLAAAGLAGSSMWVFAGQIKNESDTLRNVLAAGVYANQQIRAALAGAQSVQQEKRGNACISCGGHGYPLLERRV